jgi:hypothetical protein
MKPDTPCWIWLKSTDKKGYGRRGLCGYPYLVYRKVWEEVNGPVPEDMELHHLCGNKLCYRPDHLMCLGRTAHFYLEKMTTSLCKRGHQYSSVRLRGKKVSRRCAECSTMTTRAWRLKLKLEEMMK